MSPTLSFHRSLVLVVLAGAFVAAGCGSASDSGGGSAGAGAIGAGGAGQAGAAGSPSAASGAAGAHSGTSGAGGSLSGASGAGGAHAAGAGGTAAGGAGAGGVGGNIGSAGSAAAGMNSGGAAGSSGAAGGASGGSAGASAGSAGMGGAAGGGTTNTDYLKTRASGYGFVDIAASSSNQILSLTTTLAVPPKPKANTGTLFLWPGLQPGGANYDPIDNGVLQPVLTWGPTCAPTSPKSPYASWWISGQYVNTYGSDKGYTGCLGGTGMNVAVGDALQIVMTLNGTVWHQAVTDAATEQTVSFDLDMLGQAQNYAEFVIEQYTQDPATDVIFTATTIVFEKADAAACQPIVRGMTDFFTNPKASADGKQCTIDRIVLRAQGVAATSPN